MNAYNFDPSTRRYLGASLADPDQQRPGEWLYPAFSTHVEPPASLPAGSVAVFYPLPTEQDPHAGAWGLEELPAPSSSAPAPAPVAPAPVAAAPAPLVPVMPEELPQEQRVALVRGQLLAASDWVVLRAMERGEAVPPEWLSYRQALRDVTAQRGYPDAIFWPELPQ